MIRPGSDKNASFWEEWLLCNAQSETNWQLTRNFRRGLAESSAVSEDKGRQGASYHSFVLLAVGHSLLTGLLLHRLLRCVVV